MAKRNNLSVKYPLETEPDTLDIESHKVINKISEELATEFVNFEEKPAIVITETPKYNKVISNTILVRSTVDAIYKTTGSVSGREYVFRGSGSEVAINKEDIDELLSRRNRKGCCGSPLPTSLFEIV